MAEYSNKNAMFVAVPNPYECIVFESVFQLLHSAQGTGRCHFGKNCDGQPVSRPMLTGINSSSDPVWRTSGFEDGWMDADERLALYLKNPIENNKKDHYEWKPLSIASAVGSFDDSLVCLLQLLDLSLQLEVVSSACRHPTERDTEEKEMRLDQIR